MVIFDENLGVSDLSKYEFHWTIYVKIIKFLLIWHHLTVFMQRKGQKTHQNQLKTVHERINFTIFGIMAFEQLLFGYEQLILLAQIYLFLSYLHCLSTFWPFSVEFYHFGHKMVKNCLNNSL